MLRAVAIAKLLVKLNAFAAVGLDRKGEQSARAKNCRNSRRHGRQIEEVDKDICRDDEIVNAAVALLLSQKLDKIAGSQPVVDSLGASLSDHHGRKIDAGEMPHLCSQGPAREPSSATEIKHAVENHIRASSLNGLTQTRRSLIGKTLQRCVEAGGVLVEQGTHVGVGHGVRRIAARE